MRTFTLSSTAVLLALATACGQPDPKESAYLSVLPDERIQVDYDTSSRRAAGDPSDLQAMTTDTVEGVNTLISDVLTSIDTATSFDPTWTNGETTALWGPWKDNGNEIAVWVHLEESSGVHTWGINVRPAGAGDQDWDTVIAGQAEEGSSEEAYAGWFAIDFDLLSVYDDEVDATGGFVSSYDVDGDVVIASAAFDNVRETSASEDISAVYHYEQVVGGEGMMDLVYLTDVTGTATEELSIIRSRWLADGSGRADARVVGGDLSFLSATATECWDSSATVVFEENNYEPARDGDETLCVFEEASYNEDDGEL